MACGPPAAERSKPPQSAAATTGKHAEPEPETAEELLRRALDRSRKRDGDGALADLDAAIAKKPDFAAAYSARGRLRKSRFDFEGALADFGKALELDPTLVEPRHLRGVLYRAEKPAAAIAELSEAIRLAPGDPVIRLDRGIAYANRGDYGAAMADYSAALRLRDDFAPAYYDRAVVREALGDREGAIADLEKAIAHSSADGDFRKDAEERLEKLREKR